MRGKNHLCFLFGHVTSFPRRRDIHFTAVCPLFLFAQRMIGGPEHGVIGNSSLVLLSPQSQYWGRGRSVTTLRVRQSSVLGRICLLNGGNGNGYVCQLSECHFVSPSLTDSCLRCHCYHSPLVGGSNVMLLENDLLAISKLRLSRSPR